MVLSDMDDGGSFLDVINENDLFGNAVGPDDDGNSGFNWADEFLSTTGVDDNAANTHVVQNETISPVEVVPLSIQSQITVQQNVVNAQSYLAQSSAVPAQGVPRSSSLGGMQIVQGATGLVQQTTATPQTQQINMSAMGQLQQGLGQQIVQGPNGQLILKPGGGGQIFFQTHPQIQSLQSGTTQASSLQQVNRILAPNQSPVSTSPIVSRAITPVTSSHVGRSLTPIQSWAGVNPVTMVTNNANTPQVFTRNIPIQFNNPNAGIQLQGQSAVLQQGQGAILQQGQGQNTILQPTQGSNTLLHQGQGQTAAVLQGQGQNIVNTQNTVIQNPNVVNLNVAHVLCNNSQLQNQSGSTVHHMAPNIQGTLIQTADGKHIIIPNNTVPQTVGGQSINFQNLPQMTIQPQLNIAQNTSSGSNMVFGSTSNLPGNLGNVIRLATPGGGTTQTPAPTPDKANQPQQPSHYIGVNQQGQQILIQRTQNTAGQQQNIILRTLNPNIVQLSQQQQQQPLQTAGGIQTTPQIAGTAGTQQVLVTSQAQGIQLQRIVNTSQGQQVKLISHGGGQPAGMPLTINWQGMQNTTNSAIPTAIQVVPQQQVPKTISSSSDGSDMSVHQQQSSSQVGMVLNSQPVSVKSISNQNQYVQQQQQSQSSTPRQTVYSTPSSSKISLSSASTTPQPKDITTHTSASPHHLIQNLQTPQVSQYSGTSSTPNLSTASTTTVTTTVTQSRVPVTTTSQGTNQVMSSVQLQHLVAGASQKQNVLQARDNAPKLQHTIQLTPEAQTQLQQIQESLKKLGGVKNLSSAQKVQRKHLQELQKKILSEGQIIRQTIQSTASPLTQHLINQQTQQPVQFQSQNLIGQNVQLIGQNQNIPAAPHLVIGQQLPKQIIGQGAVMKPEVASFQGSVKEPAQGTMGIVQSQQTPTQFVQATIAGPATPAGNLVIKTEALSTSSLSTLITSSHVSPSISASLTQPTTSLPQLAKSSDVKVEPLDSAQDVSQLVTTGSTQVLMNQLPVGAVHPGVVMASAPPGKVPISASPKVALPTPIKIGNHTLNLNLTVEQKEKVQGYLSKMTPEQQQQQISLFLKLQRQQQLQAQVNAQVKAQQVLQQKQTLGPTLAPASSKLPITVQQLDSKAATATKPADLTPITAVSTTTTSTVPGLRIPFAAIPKSQLIHQQLSKDQDNALKPDTKTPFRSRRDTYRRLLRYHVFQCKSPPDDLMEKDSEMFENVAVGLVLKKQRMFDKFRLLLLKESMREKKTAEMVMIQRLMNEDLTETIKSEKELVSSDPDSFEPMPMRYLQKQESVKSEDVSMDEQETMDISKVIKSEKISESDTIEIKKEQTSRPCTPKVKLVIRNDGQNFTSSLAEDGSSDSNESSYHDNVNMDTSEVDHQNSNNSRSDSDDISKRLFGASHLTNIKREPSNDESESMESDHWSDSNKPFKLYLGTDRSDNSPVSNSDLDAGGYGNSSPSPTQNEISRSEYEVHAGDVGSPGASARRNSNTPPYEMSGESVRHVISNNNDCDNSVLGYHSSEKQPLCVNSFSEKDLYHSHHYPQQSDSSDKQSFKPSFMSDSKVPFSIENELFGRRVDHMNQSKQRMNSIGNDTELDPAVVDVAGFHQSQYEPISSPEVDHDESFSSLITHKVDSAYTIGMGEHKDPPHMSNSDLPFNVPSFSSTHLDVEPRESVEDDEATTLYSDDSDKESDSQQELLKAQMESAINSIVSLNQGSSVHSPFALDHSKEFFNRHSYMTNPTTESESDSPGPSSPVQSESPEEPMDDDLDAAVNSILM